MAAQKNVMMKTTLKSVGAVVLGLFISGCQQSTPFQSLKNPELAAQLKSFVGEKEAQARGATNQMPSEFQTFFTKAAQGDWLAISNAFMELRKHAGPNAPPGHTGERGRGTAWQAVVETFGALEAFGEGEEKYSLFLGTNIIASIPPGSIYFGGTDPGRFIVTALQKSHARAEPFFTLSQGALPDARYLEYLRGMYGTKIYTPTDGDLEKAIQNYKEDAARRQRNHQLKPGEDVTVGADGKVQIRGQMAVIQIKALLAKVIFDQNPEREFYFEESVPLDWMQPYLEPHGLIFKINRQPLPRLSSNIVEQDHAYWRRVVQPWIGDWLTDDTPLDQIATFVQRTFARQDFGGFEGDPHFIQNAYSHRAFSKLRSSLAGLYAWRMNQATDATERERMAREADFAFRQAWALDPDSPEVVFRYVALLMEQRRVADALLVAEAAAKMPSRQGQEGQTFRELVKEIQRVKQPSAGGK